MFQCGFTSTETIRLIRTGSPGRPPRLSQSSWTLNSMMWTGKSFLLPLTRGCGLFYILQTTYTPSRRGCELVSHFATSRSFLTTGSDLISLRILLMCVPHNYKVWTGKSFHTLLVSFRVWNGKSFYTTSCLLHSSECDPAGNGFGNWYHIKVSFLLTTGYKLTYCSSL